MSVGQHVTLTTVDGKSFSGVLSNIDDKVGKVVLKKVLTDGCKLPDLQTFYASDIKDLAFLEGYNTRHNCSESLLDHVVKSTPGRFLSKKDTPRHLLRAPVFNGDKILLSHIAGDDDGIDQGIGSGDDGDSFEDFYEADDYILLCRPCEKFREAICYLMEQEFVAAVFYGVEIGRKGTLSVLQVATKENIFVFDMLRLGTEGFIDGLQELLESHDVVKIIHDSRMVSDMLYHQYDIDLSNIFDTQVAGAFVFRNLHGGDWPRSVESLPSALMLHLNLSEDDIHIAYVRERSRKMDEQVWLQRPLSKRLLTSTLKNLRHLIPLYHYMCRRLMLPFKVGVDIYLDHVRSAPEGTATKQRVNSHLLPFAFQDLEKITASSCKEFNYHRQWDPTYDHKGFFENTIRRGLHHTKVIKSRDSIWHTSREGFPTSKPKNSQPQKSGGLPPEEFYNRNRKSVKSELHAPIDELSLQTSNVSIGNEKDLKDTSPVNFSNINVQDSLGGEQDLEDSTHSYCDKSHSTPVMPKSSTPNHTGQSASSSSSIDISRSALFQLDESPLPPLEPFEHEENSRSNLAVGEPNRSQIEISDAGQIDNSRSISQPGSKTSRVHSGSARKEFDRSLTGTEGNYHHTTQERLPTETLHLQSKDESGLKLFDREEVNKLSNKSCDEMNLIPAGVHIRSIGKKRAKRIQEQMHENIYKDKTVSRVSPSTDAFIHKDLDGDLGSIPMHSSLHRLKSPMQKSFNNSGYCLGDPCGLSTSFEEESSNKSILSSLNLPPCPPVTVPLSSAEDEDADEGIQESYIDEILNLEEVQKILRQTKLERPSKDIRRKLLSSKIRL